MIFDCYFGISTTIEPINVRTVDRRLQLISDKQLCHEFDLGKLETPQPEPGEKLQRFIEETKADEKGYPLCWIAEPDATIDLESLAIPEGLRTGKDLWLLIEFSLSNGDDGPLEVTVGENTIASEFHQIPTWEEVFLKLPTQAQDIEIEFKALRDDALFTIRKIALYQ